MTYEEFITKHSLKFEAKRVNARPDNYRGDMSRHFKCRIAYGFIDAHGQYIGEYEENGHSMNVYFSQGSAHTNAPTLADVLYCLAADAASYENACNFEDWASEFGYDVDSRKVEKTYRTVKRQAEQLKRVLGETGYNELLWECEEAA